VGFQRGVGFANDGRRQAVTSDHHDRVQMMGQGAVNLALGGGEFYLRHARIIKATMTQTKNSKVNRAWINEHINDPYVIKAQREGYRARAAFKLQELDDSFGLVKPGQLVVDLGSAPGAWSQYLRRKLLTSADKGQGDTAAVTSAAVIALDILPMEPVDGVVFLQGDFREADTLSRLEQAVAGRPADLVVSDMAPNLSGIASADAARIAHLVELAVEFAKAHLKPDGALVVKLFHGSGYDDLVRLFRETFRVVKPFKPKSSRDRSSETFLVGRGLKIR